MIRWDMFYCEEDSLYLTIYKKVENDIYFFRGPISGWVLIDDTKYLRIQPMTLRDWNKGRSQVLKQIRKRYPDINKYVFYLELLE